MPRLRDVRTGVVVDVDDESAAALSSAFEPVESKPVKRASEKKAPATKKSE